MHDPHGLSRSEPIDRFQLLGTVIDALTLDAFLDALGEAVTARKRLTVLHHNVHSLALFQRDESLRQAFEGADLVFVDGTPVLALARLLGHRTSFDHRLAVLDWFWPLFRRAAAEGWRVVHLGSTPPVIEVALQQVQSKLPGVDFLAYPGFFDKRPGSAGSEEMLAQVRGDSPDLILVGFGMPIQEQWIDAVKGSLPPCPVITVGGILGFIGGERRIAPRWMGRLGLEWLFRLVTEPRRLWYRYLIEPWVLVGPMVRGILGRFGSSVRSG